VSELPLTAIMILGIVLLSAGICIVARGLTEPFLLDTTEHDMRLPGDSHNPVLEVIFFSDLHAGLCRISDDRLIRALFEKPCHALLFGGDACNDGKDIKAGLRRLSIIGDRARELQIPCYAVRGNHDAKISREDFQSAGFTLLENENVPLMGRNGGSYLLLGMDDSGRRNERVWPNASEDLFDEYPVSRRIALVHNPDYVYTKNHAKYRFQLSGHFHGGQIYLPFQLEFRLFRKEKLALEGISRGPFIKNGVYGYISRGCGCVVLPVRLLSKPEITHLTFYGGTRPTKEGVHPET
jgi:predicted MPP superfamily phosphohydrolase